MLIADALAAIGIERIGDGVVRADAAGGAEGPESILDERSADIVVDCTGSETGLPTALKLVRPRGTIVLKTTVAGTQTLAWAPFVIDEVTLVGSRCGPFDRALTALERGEVKVEPLISERYDLVKGVEALERAHAKSVLKVLLNVS